MDEGQLLKQRIKQARESVTPKLSKSAMARYLDVQPSSAIQWEATEGTLPKTANLIGIAKITNVTFEWLLTGRGPMKYEKGSHPNRIEEPIANYGEINMLPLEAQKLVSELIVLLSTKKTPKNDNALFNNILSEVRECIDTEDIKISEGEIIKWAAEIYASYIEDAQPKEKITARLVRRLLFKNNPA